MVSSNRFLHQLDFLKACLETLHVLLRTEHRGVDFLQQEFEVLEGGSHLCEVLIQLLKFLQ